MKYGWQCVQEAYKQEVNLKNYIASKTKNAQRAIATT